jgi:hypothetical protein
MLGKPWTYRLEIVKAADLPVFCDLAYVQYDFFGETFTTEAVQQTTYSPVFDYSKVHHVPCVTPEFIKFLKQPFEMFIHVTQHVPVPAVCISPLADSRVHTHLLICFIFRRTRLGQKTRLLPSPFAQVSQKDTLTAARSSRSLRLKCAATNFWWNSATRKLRMRS